MLAGRIFKTDSNRWKRAFWWRRGRLWLLGKCARKGLRFNLIIKEIRAIKILSYDIKKLIAIITNSAALY